ncbi:MAG: DUF1972 domain-containing protein [Candidatus Ratteibacteria bacterium]
MKIALIGTRGIPAQYGGFETCAQELALSFVRKGHRVAVSCRRNLYPLRPSNWKGVSLFYPPAIPLSGIETLSHTFFAMVWILFTSQDAVLIFNAANSPAALFAKIFGKRVVVNVDGLEWKRAKWGYMARTYYRVSTLLSCFLADAVVADSRAIGDYYARRGISSHFISYGARIGDSSPIKILEKFSLTEKRYFFMGSRLEPENNHLLAIRSFLKADIPGAVLAIAGGSAKNSFYRKQLRQYASERIFFLGPVYDPAEYRALQEHAVAYMHGNEVGGTNPSLLQAMAAGSYIIALDVPFNREVLGDTGHYVVKEEKILAEEFQRAWNMPEEREQYGKRARERVSLLYCWEEVASSYEDLLTEGRSCNKSA